MSPKLSSIAHCRAGDKGEDSLLVVIPYDPHDFERLGSALEPRDLARHFGLSSEGAVEVIRLPALSAFVVVLRNLLGGGVTRSLGGDPHGKTLSFHLLDMSVEW